MGGKEPYTEFPNYPSPCPAPHHLLRWPSQVLSRLSWLRKPISSALWSRATPQGRLPSPKLTRLTCDTRRAIHQFTMSKVNVTKAGTSTDATRARSPHWQTSTRSLTKIRRLLVTAESRQAWAESSIQWHQAERACCIRFLTRMILPIKPYTAGYLSLSFPITKRPASATTTLQGSGHRLALLWIAFEWTLPIFASVTLFFLILLWVTKS